VYNRATLFSGGYQYEDLALQVGGVSNLVMSPAGL
jgi:hypothetical protein